MLSLAPSPGRPASVAFAAGLLFTLAALPASAADLEAQSRIAEVTVFPDRARVTRLIEVTLPAGATTVVVPGLPPGLMGESLRASGAGESRLLLGAVETRLRHGQELTREEERRLKAEIEALGDRKRQIADRIAALRFKQGVIEAIGVEFPKTRDEEGNSALPDPETWIKAWNALGEGAAEVRAEILAQEFESRELERQIAQKQKRLSQIATGNKASLEARIAVEAEAAGTATLRLTYQIGGASWRPIYDARLDAEADRVGLSQIGEVTQRTGEDWSDVALTLSTARPAIGAQAPELAAWFIDLYQPSRQNKLESRSERDRLLGQLRDEANETYGTTTASPDAPALAPAEQQTALIAAGAFAAEYRIPGRVDVPADQSASKYLIQEHALEAELSVLGVPKLGPQAYLLADVTYGGEDALLPGPVAVFRDGAFIGKSRLDLTRSGEEVQLSFGIDDRVRVEYQLVEGQRSSEGIISRDRRVERIYKVSVANLHVRPMAIEIQDQLPVSRDERIEVELLDDSTEPTARDLEDRTGVLAWRYDYAPGEEKKITFGYAVEFPEEVSVYGF